MVLILSTDASGAISSQDPRRSCSHVTYEKLCEIPYFSGTLVYQSFPVTSKVQEIWRLPLTLWHIGTNPLRSKSESGSISFGICRWWIGFSSVRRLFPILKRTLSIKVIQWAKRRFVFKVFMLVYTMSMIEIPCVMIHLQVAYTLVWTWIYCICFVSIPVIESHQHFQALVVSFIKLLFKSEEPSQKLFNTFLSADEATWIQESIFRFTTIRRIATAMIHVVRVEL